MERGEYEERGTREGEERIGIGWMQREMREKTRGRRGCEREKDERMAKGKENREREENKEMKRLEEEEGRGNGVGKGEQEKEKNKRKTGERLV